jgi:hypothetical protein
MKCTGKEKLYRLIYKKKVIMKWPTLIVTILLSAFVQLSAQPFYGVYPGLGFGVSSVEDASGLIITTQKGILKVGPQGQTQWYRDIQNVTIFAASSLSGGLLSITGFQNDNVYLNTVDTSGTLYQATVYEMTNHLGFQDIGHTVIQSGNERIIGGTYRLPNTAGTEAFFMKVNSFGNVSNAYTIGGLGAEAIVDILPRANGGGYSMLLRTDSDGSGGVDMMLIQVTQFGMIQGYSMLGGAEDDYGWSMYELNNGGFVVVGQTHSIGAQAQAFLSRFDASGSLLWSKAYPAGGMLTDVKELPDGSLLLLGNRGDMLDAEDILLIKADASGEVVWAKYYGEANQEERAGKLSLLSNGELLIIGASGAAPFDDLLVIRTDADGNVDGCTGTTVNTTAATIFLNNPQPGGQTTYNPIPAGQITRTYVLTNVNFPALSPNICVPTPVGVADIHTAQGYDLIVFPNPAVAMPSCRIYAPKQSNATAQIMNLAGQVLLSESLSLSKGFQEWTPADIILPTGIYIAYLTDGEHRTMKRFVIR